jgi:hypothetical protein
VGFLRVCLLTNRAWGFGVGLLLVVGLWVVLLIVRFCCVKCVKDTLQIAVFLATILAQKGLKTTILALEMPIFCD